ncbi:hypothetical protein ACNFIA_17380 [Pseudomonas sp. NY15437]|uniref:hypothetical protein n=1 Tax=Pseudomonas sp. NY15437 TaxID=3400360 RepID=UPI003A8B70AD
MYNDSRTAFALQAMLLFASAVAFAFSVIQMVLTQIPIALTEGGFIGLAMGAGTLLVTTLCVSIESVALGFAFLLASEAVRN